MRNLTAFIFIGASVPFLSLLTAGGEDFIAGSDSTPIFEPEGFEAGDRLIFRDSIEAFGDPAVVLMPPVGGATYLFEEASDIRSNYSRSAIEVTSYYYGDFQLFEFEPIPFEGGVPPLMEEPGPVNFTLQGDVSSMGSAIIFDDDYTGTFNNSGTMSALDASAVLFEYDFTGNFINSGTISSDSFYGGEEMFIERSLSDFEGDDYFEDRRSTVAIFGNVVGNITNSGTIEGNGGVAVGGNMTGNFTNSKTIESEGTFGVLIAGNFDGDFVNSGTITPLELSEDDFYPAPPIRELDEGDSDFIGLEPFRIPLYPYPMEPVYLEYGAQFEGTFNGLFSNSGTIRSDSIAAYFGDDFTGRFENTNTITGGNAGVSFERNFDGTFTNTGTITAGAEEVSMDLDDILYEGEGLMYLPIRDSFFEGPRTGVRVGDSFTGNFLNSGTIEGEDAGVYFNDSFSGRFENSGRIDGRDEKNGVGIFFEGNVSGEFVNSNLIIGTYRAIYVADPFEGNLTNSGRIAALEDNAIYFDSFTGELNNTGVIDSPGAAAISSGSTTGTINNRGGRISGKTNSIELGGGNGTVVLSGVSVIDGTIDGGDGDGDVLRFENVRGVSSEKRAELEALANADRTGESSVTLFGETINWSNFEDVQVDFASLTSYEELFSTTGFEGYGAALDNVKNLNEELRVFLNALNDLDEDDLKVVAANSSGQTVAAAAENYVRSQGSEVFSLFSAEFSSLRGGGNGGGSGVASNQRTGLFTREIQVGVTINEPVDESRVYITGYVGNGTQDPDANQTESSIDSTSIMFGRSEAVSSQWRVGLWGGYTDNDANVDSFGSEFKSEAGFIGATAQFEGDYGFSNLVFGYGFHDQTTIRRDFLGNEMFGDAVGHQGLVHGQFGRDYYFGAEEKLQASPYVGFALSRLSMGGYTEDGPAATSLRFDSQTTDSVQSVVGINVSSYRETSRGWVRPKVDAAWWHEFADANSLGVSLAADGLINPFQIEGNVSNRDRAVVQVGMELGFDKWENVTFDATYFGTYGEDGYSSHGGALSAEIAF